MDLNHHPHITRRETERRPPPECPAVPADRHVPDDLASTLSTVHRCGCRTSGMAGPAPAETVVATGDPLTGGAALRRRAHSTPGGSGCHPPLRARRGAGARPPPAGRSSDVKPSGRRLRSSVVVRTPTRRSEAIFKDARFRPLGRAALPAPANPTAPGPRGIMTPLQRTSKARCRHRPVLPRMSTGASDPRDQTRYR